MSQKKPLAIIGIGARFPGNINYSEGLWEALASGVDGITDIPSDRWSIEKYYDPNPDKAEKIKSKRGGFIKGMKEFDAEFFDIYPKVAEALDPRQRHLLEVAYESIEDAGLRLDQLNGSNTAVIIGVFLGDDSKKIAGSDLEAITPHSAMGSADTTVSARIAYQFNLNGPTFSVDTACSSSLVAIHLACSSIWADDAEMAIAGGVNIMTGHEHTLQLSKGNFLSSEGYCKSFDASGSGYVRGEGAGVVIIKPLDQAQKDGNNIYAVIRNTVVNSDGYTSEGITVPNEFAQIKMLKKAYQDAGINPADVDFMEAHGTGTAVGDPKECFAFGNVFAEGRKANNPLIIGSIKSNIGHTEAVAGVAGLIKLALCLKNKQIPKNLHFKTPNPKIKFEEWNLKVSTELMEWPSKKNRKAIGGVNSFGAGGTNAHAVLEEYVANEEVMKNNEEKQLDFPHFFTFSAKSSEALKALAKKYIDFINDDKHSLDDLCYSLVKNRSRFPEKLIIITDSKEHLVAALDAYIKDEKYEGLILGNTKDKKLKIAFICSGQGPQWYAMGRQLIMSSKVFAEVVTKIDRIFFKLSGYSLLDEMNKSAKDSRISETRIAQPAIMAVQIGLIEMWKFFGILPEGIVGHSIGEVAAAYGAGSLTLEQAVNVIYNRSREQDKASGAGKMLAVGLTHLKALQRIRDMGSKVSIAALNGPEMTVLSGDSEPLEDLAKALEKEEIFNRFLQINVPFHSHHMDMTKDEMLKSLKDLKSSKANISLYSTVSGKKEDGLHLTNEYWYKNVRETVYFTTAIEKMIEDDFNYFIEIAPHPILGGGVNDVLIATKKEGEVISSLSRKIKEFEAGIKYEEKDFLNAVAKAYISNPRVDLEILFFGTNAKSIKLPHYVWQHKEYWLESKEHEEARVGKAGHPFIKSAIKQLSSNSAIYELNLNSKREIFLTDHQIGGTIVFPGTAQFEVACAAAKEQYGINFSHLEKIEFHNALFLSENSKTEARLEIISEQGDYKIFSRTDNQSWIHNGSGRICCKEQSFDSNNISLDELKKKITQKVNVEKFYNNLKEGSLYYGPHFKLVKEMWQNDDEILARIELSDEDDFINNQYSFIPSLSDACLHIILAHPKDGVFLPIYFEKYKVYRKPTKSVWSYAKINKINKSFMLGSIASYNQDGSQLSEAHGIKLKYLENSRRTGDEYNGVYEYRWIEKNLEAPEKNIALENDECILLFTDNKISKNLKLKNAIVINQGSNYLGTSEGFTINPFVKEDYEKLFVEIANQKKKIGKIINLWPSSISLEERSSDKDFCDNSKKLIEPTLYLLQELTKIDYELTIYQITNHADLVSDKDCEMNFLQGSLYGMGRVFINEYPAINFRMIDLGCKTDLDNAKKLQQEIFKKDAKPFETEVALRDYGRFARQLTKINKADDKNTADEEEMGFDKDATYLITGGASGLGLALTEWMFKKGAKNFALVSRSGPKYDSDKSAIANMIKSGANISYKEVMGDLAIESDVNNIIRYITKNMPPLKGIIHCAGLLGDATFPNMTMDKFVKIYNPKALGAWNLHKATLDQKLDLFLLVSSVSSIVGIAGQNNYASANSFLNHLAIYRRLKGLTAHSSCFGLLSGEYAGMSKEDPKVVAMVSNTVGTNVMSWDEVTEKLEGLLLSDSPYRMLSPMNWNNFYRSFSGSINRYAFNQVLTNELKDKVNGEKNRVKDLIANLSSEEEKLSKTDEILKNALSGILGVPTKNFDSDKSITNIGLDSLMLNQFRNWIQSNLEINIPLMKLAKGPNLKELSANIIAMIDASGSNESNDTSGIDNNNDIEVIANKWLIKAKSNTIAKTRIFCLHPVGAGASMFSYFMFNPPKDCEVIAIQMPGRENRAEEEFYTDMTKLIPDLAQVIAPYIDRTTLFWGHSWGGIALFEVAKYLRNNIGDKYQNLARLIVTASIAPQLTKPWKNRDSIKESANKSSTAEKIISTVSYIDDENFLRKIIPIMKNDMEMIMTYKYQPEEKLSIPITAFGAKEDDVVLLDELRQWKDQTSDNFTMYDVHGDHWFLSRNKEFILEKINNNLSGAS